MVLGRSLSLEMGSSEYLGWQCHFRSSTGKRDWFFLFVSFLFVCFSVVKESDSKYLGLCWPATTELCHCRLKASLNCTYQMGVVVFQKTLDRNKADLIPCQSLLTLALEKTLKFRIHFLYSFSMTLLFKSIFHRCGAVKYWVCVCSVTTDSLWLHEL